MGKQETVDKYMDAFLKGRSCSVIEKFKAKPLHLQYASIIQWRRRLSKQENTPKNTKEILEALRKVNALIINAPEISNEDIDAIKSELDGLHDTLRKYFEQQRRRRIDELEAQQRSISEQLELLRNG